MPFPLTSPCRFSRSVQEPGRASRRLHAGCRSGRLRASPELVPQEGSPPGFDIAYPETRTAHSGRRAEADVVSHFLDAVGELGGDPGFVAFDKKIGAKVLVECAIPQHVVGGSQRRGRHPVDAKTEATIRRLIERGTGTTRTAAVAGVGIGTVIRIKPEMGLEVLPRPGKIEATAE